MKTRCGFQTNSGKEDGEISTETEKEELALQAPQDFMSNWGPSSDVMFNMEIETAAQKFDFETSPTFNET